MQFQKLDIDPSPLPVYLALSHLAAPQQQLAPSTDAVKQHQQQGHEPLLPAALCPRVNSVVQKVLLIDTVPLRHRTYKDLFSMQELSASHRMIYSCTDYSCTEA